MSHITLKLQNQTFNNFEYRIENFTIHHSLLSSNQFILNIIQSIKHPPQVTLSFYKPSES